MIPFRRRPLPKSAYSYIPRAKGPSLRHELILGGAVRKYPDGREVCQDSPAGMKEYKRRLIAMLRRQEYLCCLCGKKLYFADATFEHQRRRGMGAAFRDDRVEKDGEDFNGAAHWICNVEKG